MEVYVTDIKLVLLPQAHFSLFRKDNAQKRIFLKMYSRTLSRINITLRWWSVHKIPMVYITPRDEISLVDNIVIYSPVYFFLSNTVSYVFLF